LLEKPAYIRFFLVINPPLLILPVLQAKDAEKIARNGPLIYPRR